VNAPLTGPTWYLLAGTIALVLVLWAMAGVVAGAVYGAWNRRQARRESLAQHADRSLSIIEERPCPPS
jgi:uncharacterized membrane protein YfcA